MSSIANDTIHKAVTAANGLTAIGRDLVLSLAEIPADLSVNAGPRRGTVQRPLGFIGWIWFGE